MNQNTETAVENTEASTESVAQETSAEQVSQTETAAVAPRRVGRPTNPDSRYQQALAYRNANPSLSNKDLREYMTDTLKIPKASAQVYLSKFKKAAGASATAADSASAQSE